MTKLKSPEALTPLTEGKVFLLMCRGCSEVGFPEQEARRLRRTLAEEGRLTGALVADYLCSPPQLELRLMGYAGPLGQADRVLVLSCGVGVQTAASLLEDIPTAAGCDTVALPGFAGAAPSEYDCGRCGQCYLNITGGICPITACSKSLLNGPCGGAKDGKCEVSPALACGWARIEQRLRELGRTDALQQGVQLRDHSIRRKPEQSGGTGA